jgi:hypothetical protein
MTRPGLYLFAAVITMLSACANHGTYVEASDAALGRVVVYRNGIAYYERQAHVDGDTLTLAVPHDKVDDFLKSLTVKHAATGETVPISYPTLGASREDVVDMAIKLPKKGPHDLIITYITEAPAWKPSYRVVVSDDGMEVQGWAIVDNTSGEDWEAVKVGVGSSSALSFRYDLRSIVNVHRQTLGDQHRFAQAPPTGSVERMPEKEALTLAKIDAHALPVPEGHPAALAGGQAFDRKPTQDALIGGNGSVFFHGRGVGRGGHAEGLALGSGRTKSPKIGRLDSGASPYQKKHRMEVMRLADELQNNETNVVIEGYAEAYEEEPEERSIDRANRLRNELIALGVAPQRIEVQGMGNVSGKSAGIEVKVAQNNPVDDGAGSPVGESHFESETPMTIARGTSAMVNIVNANTDGKVVYLYAPDDKRGHERFAFKAVRFENPTDSTLETGPVTVYGDGRFIGEGLTESVPPGSMTMVPFALDRQIVVERDRDTGDQISRLLKVNRGVCTAEIKHKRTTKLTVTNRLVEPAKVFVRHLVRKGWTLEKSPEVIDRQGETHLLGLSLGAGETKTFQVVESTPLERTMDLRSDLGVTLIRGYLKVATPDPEFAQAMGELLSLYETMQKEQEAILSLRDRIQEFRSRNHELHGQIATLKLVKVRGELMTHLKRKMKETSQRIQDATIAVVDHKERLMLSRIRFQDGLSELSLESTRDTAKRSRGESSEPG